MYDAACFFAGRRYVRCRDCALFGGFGAGLDTFCADAFLLFCLRIAGGMVPSAPTLRCVKGSVQAADNFPKIFLLIAGIVGAAMVLNTVVIAWNKALPFPDWLPALTRWMAEQQDLYDTVVGRLFVSHTLWDYLPRLFVIALLPAVGEELIFRCLLQRELSRLTGRVHVGIFLSAFLFAIFHLQWAGLFPRMLLGVLLGYLYHISASFTTAVLVIF